MKDALLSLCLMAPFVAACDGAVHVVPTAKAIPEPQSASGCGGDRQPDCHLKAWMRATLQPYLATGGADNQRLASALERLAGAAPPGYPRWAAIARTATAAARNNDLGAVKQACADCHNSYRVSFRATMRARRLF